MKGTYTLEKRVSPHKICPILFSGINRFTGGLLLPAGALGVFVLARKRQENMSLPLHMELILSTETKKEFT
jgi:hypothetical protein